MLRAVTPEDIHEAYAVHTVSANSLFGLEEQNDVNISSGRSGIWSQNLVPFRVFWLT